MRRIFLLTCFQLLFSVVLFADNTIVDKLKSAMALYVNNGSYESYEKLQNVFLSQEMSKRVIQKAQIITEHNIGIICTRIEKLDLNAMEVSFYVLQYSDGSYTEIICTSLGKIIKKDPKVFLMFVKKHFALLKEYRLESILCGLGISYVDDYDRQIKEYKERIKKLETVNATELMSERNYCIAILKRYCGN